MESHGYTFGKILEVFEPTTIKTVVAVVMSLGSFFFSELYIQGLIAVVMLMVIDTVFGLCASYKEGKHITSRRFYRSIIKGIVYLTAISAGHFADLTVPLDVIESTMIAFIGVTEFISIMENVGRMGFNTPKKLLNQLSEKYVK